MNDSELSTEIKHWFTFTGMRARLVRRRWKDTRVGATIRSELLLTGNWKNAPRGNPKAGYAKAKANNEA